MSRSRPSHHSGNEPAGFASGLLSAWVRFWFTPVDPIGLHAMRMFAGLLFFAWLLPFAGNQDALFGLGGWFDRRAYSEAARLPGGSPVPITWSFLYLCRANPALLSLAYWFSLAALLLFTLGIGTRPTAILTWIVVASFTANPAIAYDADYLLVLLAFYLMIGYVFLGQWTSGQTLTERLLGPRGTSLLSRSQRTVSNSLAANLAMRLLQVNFAIVLMTAGLHKLQFGDWWAGVALWYPLHPAFTSTLEGVRARISNPGSYMTLLSLATYATLAWQIGFPLFAWRGRLRPILLGGAAVGWLGAAFIYELPLFGPAIFVSCLSYLTSEEWNRILTLGSKVPGLHWLALRLPVAPEQSVEVGKKTRDGLLPVASRHR